MQHSDNILNSGFASIPRSLLHTTQRSVDTQCKLHMIPLQEVESCSLP